MSARRVRAKPPRTGRARAGALAPIVLSDMNTRQLSRRAFDAVAPGSRQAKALTAALESRRPRHK